MNPDTVLDRIIQANPKPASAETPGNILTRSALLDELDRRSGNMQPQDKPIIVKPEPPRLPRRSRLGPALVGAFVVIIAIVVAVALLSSDDEPDVTNEGLVQTTAPAPTTTVATTTTTASATTTNVPAVSSQDALAATDAYFAAFNAGDTDAALALLTIDGSFTDRFGGQLASDLDIADELAWFTAQGTVLTSPSCAVTEDQPVEGTTLSCDYETLDALTQAVDALPVPTTTSFTITSVGISEIHLNYAPQPGQPDFLHVVTPFRSWMFFNRPDVTCLGWYVNRSTSCVDSTSLRLASVEETREVGIMVARYAEEWAAYLDENGCGYLDGC